MPVRSLRSSVLKWPDRAQVDAAVREWAAQVALSRPEVVRIGYFGSYARGDWGWGATSTWSPSSRRAICRSIGGRARGT